MASDPRLDQLEQELEAARRSSGQASYDRALPASQSIEPLARVRQALREETRRSPTTERAWRLLSQAQEILVDYAAAILSLEHAIALSGQKDTRDLKRLARLRADEAKLRRRVARKYGA